MLHPTGSNRFATATNLSQTKKHLVFRPRMSVCTQLPRPSFEMIDFNLKKYISISFPTR